MPYGEGTLSVFLYPKEPTRETPQKNHKLVRRLNSTSPSLAKRRTSVWDRNAQQPLGPRDIWRATFPSAHELQVVLVVLEGPKEDQLLDGNQYQRTIYAPDNIASAVLSSVFAEVESKPKEFVLWESRPYGIPISSKNGSFMTPYNNLLRRQQKLKVSPKTSWKPKSYRVRSKEVGGTTTNEGGSVTRRDKAMTRGRYSLQEYPSGKTSRASEVVLYEKYGQELTGNYRKRVVIVAWPETSG
ncbi:hypothetical protein BJY52DRAFT_1416908 [Lactarius psammicola]|nr:hypothetical protein BJY52DRAFT_1416908 [Lactarius psammicola]